MRQRWYALNVIAPITLLFHKRRNKMPSEAMVMGYALLEKITQMEETITMQSEEITALLKAIKEYERGERECLVIQSYSYRMGM
jgi:hypothetical protein